ncbi:MAG: aminopeptidase P family protein [Acidobacteria bacterium]|nr:aminopeptidase P family protein [Acidobacteriota bacterium]
MEKSKREEIWAAAINRRELLQFAGGGVLISMAGLATAASAQSSKPSAKADRSKLREFPTLSLKERDRRWNAARKLMQDHKVEAMLVVNYGAGGDTPDNFFTNHTGATVVFPMQGLPVALAGSDDSATIGAGIILENEEAGETSWIRDWRFGKATAPYIADLLKRMGFANSRIGAVGLTRGTYFGRRDGTPGLANYLKANLPGATFVELWDGFLPIWMAKSEEEMAVVRKSALLGEVACEAMVEMVKPGVTEADIYAATQYEIMRFGGRTSWMILQTGPTPSGWGSPIWQYRPQKPRIIKEGDIILTELFPHYGPFQTQQQMCIAVGKVADVNHKLAATAREIYEIGLKEVKPGAKWADVCAKMNEPNVRKGYWHLTPNIHSVNPLDAVSEVIHGLEQFTALLERFGRDNLPVRGVDAPNLVLQPGMTLAFETNSSSKRNRINIGGTVVVTRDGCEELNRLANYLYITA